MVHETRSYVYTKFSDNVSSDQEFFNLLDSDDNVVYHCAGIELCPQTNKRHLQGYVQLKMKRSVASLGKKLKCFVTVPKGSVQQCIDYSKKDGNFVERGTPKGLQEDKGEAQRKRWERILELSKKGDFANLEIEFPSALLIHNRSIKSIRDQFLKPEYNAQRKAIYIHGVSGCGKTRWVHENFNSEDLFVMTDIGSWDQYCQEKFVLLDELDEEVARKWKLLCRWMDRYPCRANVKFGSTALNYELIVITSMFPLEALFKDEALAAIKRRLIVVEAMKWSDEFKDLIIKDPNGLIINLRNYLFKYDIIF